MKKLVTIMAVLTVVATPAFAQYDPGSNIGAIHSEAFYSNVHRDDAANARAQAVPHQQVGPSAVTRPSAQPLSRNDQIRFDPAKGEI